MSQSTELPDRLESLREWIVREMPAGTVIGDPAWWAERIARRAQPEVETPQADPYALDDDDVARFPNDANVVIVHKDYYWKLRGCEDVCAALGAEPAAQHAESGAQAAISDTEIHNHLGHWGVLPTKTGEPERVTAGREKLLVTAIQELLSKVYAATRLRDVRSLALEGNRLINGALAAQSQGAHSAPGTPEAPASFASFAKTRAAHDVLVERWRQVEVEGWTPEHDDMHSDGQMAVAAGYYALASGSPYERSLGRGHMPVYWPWAPSWWKPRTKRENLVRAGALMLAEIERLDRTAQLDGGQGEGEKA